MNKPMAVIGGMGLGAGLMFLLDPELGRRRRHLIGDKTRSWAGDAEDRAAKLGRDVSNRARGLVAETRSRLHEEAVDDAVLVERVRSAVGRATTHAGAIQVSAQGGQVTISGPVLSSEREAVLAAAGKVRGVCGIDDRTDPHETAESIPALQGGMPGSQETSGM